MTRQRDTDTFSEKETRQRFDAILHGSMHKPTPHKDIPKHRTNRTNTRKKEQRHEAK